MGVDAVGPSVHPRSLAGRGGMSSGWSNPSLRLPRMQELREVAHKASVA